MQVIKAFGDPEFFNTCFPQLLDMCNSAASGRAAQAPAQASDASKEGSS